MWFGATFTYVVMYVHMYINKPSAVYDGSKRSRLTRKTTFVGVFRFRPKAHAHRHPRFSALRRGGRSLWCASLCRGGKCHGGFHVHTYIHSPHTPSGRKRDIKSIMHIVPHDGAAILMARHDSDGEGGSQYRRLLLRASKWGFRVIDFQHDGTSIRR
jgi:hypothetical protein